MADVLEEIGALQWPINLFGLNQGTGKLAKKNKVNFKNLVTRNRYQLN